MWTEVHTTEKFNPKKYENYYFIISVYVLPNEGNGTAKTSKLPRIQKADGIKIGADVIDLLFFVEELAGGNFAVVRLAPGPQPELELPGPHIGFWANLAPGPQLWWVESRDSTGRIVAQSSPRWLMPRASNSR